jgi:hypothetical protein
MKKSKPKKSSELTRVNRKRRQSLMTIRHRPEPVKDFIATYGFDPDIADVFFNEYLASITTYPARSNVDDSIKLLKKARAAINNAYTSRPKVRVLKWIDTEICKLHDLKASQQSRPHIKRRNKAFNELILRLFFLLRIDDNLCVGEKPSWKDLLWLVDYHKPNYPDGIWPKCDSSGALRKRCARYLGDHPEPPKDVIKILKLRRYPLSFPPPLKLNEVEE